MSFPLYRRPGGVIFLDDDPDYLEMIADVMPAEWHVRLFQQPVDCINELQQEPPRWERDFWKHQEMIQRWHNGAPLIPQIMQYWREEGMARFDLTQVGVMDYSMPAMNGLQVLGELMDWPGARILLTGLADEQLAVSAFNQGLIEQFIPKQSPDIRLRLTEAIQRLLTRSNARYQAIWRATLPREYSALLGFPAVAQDLEALVLKQGWIEHILLGEPFGILALDSIGEVSWLQLESAENLPELAELAQSQGWSAAHVSEIRNGSKLIDLELQLALGSAHKPRMQKALTLGKEQRLHAAIFPVKNLSSSNPVASYQRFMAACGERKLRD